MQQRGGHTVALFGAYPLPENTIPLSPESFLLSQTIKYTEGPALYLISKNSFNRSNHNAMPGGQRKASFQSTEIQLGTPFAPPAQTDKIAVK